VCVCVCESAAKLIARTSLWMGQVRGERAPVLRAGEEVYISYGDGQRLTPDETLSYYGFVEGQAGHRELCTLGSCCIMLPAFASLSAFNPTSCLTPPA